MCRSISDFKKSSETRNDVLKEEKGEFVADLHNILASWRNGLSQR